MKASVVDLRYKMKDVLRALDRNEKVTILYHGKAKGIITPANNEKYKKVKEHPFFGMSKNDKKSVSDEITGLRELRL
jgi:hypothetical protein